ncbi:glycine betaine ABC transporter substrate-binding protein [Brachybacterium sacelli]|uniref:Glycine betaine/proline transport system substrate-binding protein n=1 Tax=Brachybacterium sacelli TaxID=173364 RepID=A0ABS4X3R8_9MICO|nr:glycine betaine ABC transporter substrate-binding protein [Brachybacterium sacelli]MBP2383114.1 glycine betaine/proline transport system substrate-binding protein [Brachybacterium sacelli]
MTYRRLTLPRSSVSRRAAMLGGGAGLMGLGLAACGGSGDGGSGGGSGSDSGGGAGDTIKLGYISSWSDGLSMAYLLENRLTAMGFKIEHTEISDAGLLYAGLSEGDVDINPSGWPEVTHKAYMDEYGDKIEDLDAWYEGAKLNLSVPGYVDISSIEELVGQGDRFGGRIVGIESGAGLTSATQDSVMPEYGLDEDFELVTSSTPAMLTELGSAIDAEEDIVVTLWTPFWANSTYDVTALEDPKGAFGEAEALHILGRSGFQEDFPEVADYLSQIKISDEQYNALEDKVVNEFGEGKEAEAVEAWLEENPDVIPEPPEA